MDGWALQNQLETVDGSAFEVLQVEQVRRAGQSLKGYFVLSHHGTTRHGVATADRYFRPARGALHSRTAALSYSPERWPGLRHEDRFLHPAIDPPSLVDLE